jgi:hypothetical protein
MAAAVRIRNRVYSVGAGGVPYELVTCRRADFSSMRVFGCPTYVPTPQTGRLRMETCVCGLCF